MYKISVIVPVYNTQKFLASCLDSILAQSIKGLELIIVNDASKDNSAQIIKEYADKYKNIVVINHEKNKGLYQARISGIKAANGEYLAFVDSDDTVSVDWFRMLVKKADEENADMVVGNTINIFEDGNQNYFSIYRSLTHNRPLLTGDEIFNIFLEQEGECFLWHTVWNKVYKKSLINRALPDLEKLNEHVIMTEDIAYSFVLFYHAKAMAFSDTDAYFYYRHSEASTSLSLPKEKFEKNLKDLGTVFRFVEKFIEEKSPENYQRFKAYKDKYFRIWSSNLIATSYSNDAGMRKILLDSFGEKKLKEVLPHEFYFYELTSPWDGRLEAIKKQILDKKYPIISFDVFDTLLLRPFYDPKDIFYFVARNVSHVLKLSSLSDFYKMRVCAEQHCRAKQITNTISFEEVTLTEIYDTFAEIYGYTDLEVRLIQKTEEELELKFCYARQTAKELFELALYAGKRVILVSDMYIDYNLLTKILEKAGYRGYEKLYLSSRKRKLKATGKLYRGIINELKCNASDILHIGDNWNSDIIKAQEIGINTIFMPNTRETFENIISDIYTGNCSKPMTNVLDGIIDFRKTVSQLPLRIMYALAANMMFDNPFKNFQPASDYNGDPYFIGYYCLGMHIFGVAKWIFDNAKDKYSSINFLARDGKVIKEAFDMIVRAEKAEIKSKYVYATRKALFPLLIKDSRDLFDVVNLVDVTKYTFMGILELLAPVVKEFTPELTSEYKKRGVLLDEKIESVDEYLRFVKIMGELSFDEDKAKASFDAISKLFKELFEDNSACFDIGYSGRLQHIINSLSGKSMDALFIHDNGFDTKYLANDKGFGVYSFYDFSPSITAIIREYLISGVEPSCGGYFVSENGLEPVFCADNNKYSNLYGINEMHRGALDFCAELVSRFEGYMDLFTTRAIEVSAPLEYYLTQAKEFDRYIFCNSLLEDEVYSRYNDKYLFDVWNWHLQQIEQNSCLPKREKIITNNPEVIRDVVNITANPIENRSFFAKALYYFLFEQRLFWKKSVKWLKNKIRRDRKNS